jgi:hypothetical protein
MNRKEVEQYLIDFQKKELPALINRNLKTPSGSHMGKITAVIGPRRAGKTFYLYQKIMEMVGDGTERKNIVYLNFESTKLFDLSFREIREAIELHNRIFSTTEKPVVFLDEPQVVENWERAVRELHDDSHMIFISGSSSKLLGKEIATSLRGRSLSYMLMPFSFSEFMKMKGIKTSGQPSTDEKTKILSALDEYVEFGGFPEVVLEADKESKLRILESYLDLTIYKDIVERHGIKDSMLVKWFIKAAISSYSKEISINKIYTTLKAQGRKTSKDELYSYASVIGDALFVFYLPKFSWSVMKREPTSKAYLCDTGFSKFAEVAKDAGRKMENVVYLELIRRMAPLTEIYYWKNTMQEEVDFVVKKGNMISELIQVCRDVSDEETVERETRALIKASKELKCHNLTIITDDTDSEKEYDGKKVKFIPLWKWLVG